MQSICDRDSTLMIRRLSSIVAQSLHSTLRSHSVGFKRKCTSRWSLVMRTVIVEHRGRARVVRVKCTFVCSNESFKMRAHLVIYGWLVHFSIFCITTCKALFFLLSWYTNHIVYAVRIECRLFLLSSAPTFA